MSDSTDQPSERDSQLDELVDEFVRARRSGDSVSREEIVAANPELEPDLSERLGFAESLVQAVQKAESEETVHLPAQGRSERLRCPHCGNIVQVVDDSEEVTCGSCGSSLGHDEEATQHHSPSSAQIGHFELIERVGRGGFGVVYRALDTRLQRQVALKIPRRGCFGTEDEETRFLREARSAANLRHPNIVQVFEVGTESGSHYIAAEFIEGMNLADVLKGQQLDFRKAAALLEKIAAALHHAHEHGVIHRDIKPANILIDANEQPFLTDFGLARNDEPAITITQEGEVLGTPAYMSPEQAAAEHSKMDRRSDVYSLGVTLFRMLSGELPFRGSRRMLLNKVMHDDPPSVRSLNETVPRDLETIALRAMEKAPEKRYQSALEFEQELHRWLAGDPILARPISTAERAWRWCKKRPVISSLLATIAVLLFSISIGAAVWAVRENRLKEIATASDIESRERLASAFASAAAERLDDDNSLASLPYAVEALGVQQSLESPQAKLTRIQLETTMAASPRLLHLESVGEGIKEILRRPDGQGFLVSFGSTIRLYDMDWQKSNPELKAEHEIRSVAFNGSNDRILAFAHHHHGEGRVTLWDARDGRRIANPVQPMLLDAVFSPDGSQIATTGGEAKAEVRVWSATDGQLQFKLTQDGTSGAKLRFSPDGKRLAVQSFESLKEEIGNRFWLSVWTLASKEEVKVAVPENELFYFEFLPDGSLLTMTESGVMQRYTADGERDAEFLLKGESRASHTDNPQSQFSPIVFGQHGVVTRRADSVRIWDLEKKHLKLGPIRHGGFIDTYGFAISPDLTMFATAGQHDRVNVFRTETGERVGPAIGNGTTVRAVEFLDDTVLVTGTTSGIVKIWDLAGITRNSAVLKHDNRLVNAEFSPDSRRVATTTYVENVGKSAIWNRTTEEKLSEVEHAAPAMAVGFSPDGRTLVSSDFAGGLIIRDALGIDDRHETRKDVAWVNNIRFPANANDVFATTNNKGDVRIWHTNEDQPVHSFQHSQAVWFVDFDPTGRFLASCSEDGSARVWDTDSGEPAGPLLNDKNRLARCKFSPDGKLVGTSGNSGQLILWDWTSGEARTTFVSPGRQDDFDFSSDGSQLCSTSAFGFVQIWDRQNPEQPKWSFSHPQINSVDWHPQLPLVVAAGDRKRPSDLAFARIWDTLSGLPLSPKLPHAGSTTASFSPDGTAILTRSADTTVRIWSIEPTPHDLETLRALAVVLSGSAMEGHHVVPVAADEQVRAFNELRNSIPNEFTPSQKERKRFKTLHQLRNHQG